MDVPEQKGLRPGAEERPGGELVIESRHRYAVFGHASVHGAVRHADRRHAGRARGFVDRGKAAEQRRQLLAHRGRRFGGTHRRGHHGLVHGRHAGKERPRARRDLLEAPALRFQPAAVLDERHLLQPVGDVDPEPPAQQPEHVERPWRLVREGSVQHQHRAVVGEPPDVARQGLHRRRMHFQRMIGRVPRDHRAVHPACDRRIDGEAEAPIHLGQRRAGVVEVRKMRYSHHDSSFVDCRPPFEPRLHLTRTHRSRRRSCRSSRPDRRGSFRSRRAPGAGRPR